MYSMVIPPASIDRFLLYYMTEGMTTKKDCEKAGVEKFRLSQSL